MHDTVALDFLARQAAAARYVQPTTAPFPSNIITHTLFVTLFAGSSHPSAPAPCSWALQACSKVRQFHPTTSHLSYLFQNHKPLSNNTRRQARDVPLGIPRPPPASRSDSC
jgi:hypothetical protein